MIQELCMAVLCFGSLQGLAQAPEQPEELVEHVPPVFGVRYTLWFADFQFDVETASERVEADLAWLQGIDVTGRFELSEAFDLEIRGALLLGTQTQALVGYVGARHWLEASDVPWRWSLGAGLLFGTLDMDDIAGGFEPALGIETGVLVDYLLERWMAGLSVSGELALRFLEFDFDADDAVLESDGSIGGFGLVALVGAELRF